MGLRSPTHCCTSRLSDRASCLLIRESNGAAIPRSKTARMPEYENFHLLFLRFIYVFIFLIFACCEGCEVIAYKNFVLRKIAKTYLALILHAKTRAPIFLLRVKIIFRIIDLIFCRLLVVYILLGLFPQCV